MEEFPVTRTQTQAISIQPHPSTAPLGMGEMATAVTTTLAIALPFSSQTHRRAAAGEISSPSFLRLTQRNPSLGSHPLTSLQTHPVGDTRRPGGRFPAECLPSPPNPSPAISTKLFVSGLSFRTTEESLRNTFQNFGELVEVNLVMDRIANRPRGFAFLRYATVEESKKAIEGMHGKFLDGRVIFVEVSKPRSELRRSPKPPSYFS